MSCRNSSIDSYAVVQYLLHSGAHIDCVNKANLTPLEVAQKDSIRTLLKSQQSPSRLKCLCARLIVEKRLPYEFIWAKETEMNTFLFFHSVLSKQ